MSTQKHFDLNIFSFSQARFHFHKLYSKYVSFVCASHLCKCTQTHGIIVVILRIKNRNSQECMRSQNPNYFPMCTACSLLHFHSFKIVWFRFTFVMFCLSMSIHTKSNNPKETYPKYLSIHFSFLLKPLNLHHTTLHLASISI